jgi:hypothetical protein
MAKKLVDMKRTAAEKKAEREKYDKPGSIGGDDYGYGLGVRLDHHHLEKLGIKNLPKAGAKIMLHARAHVKSVGQNSRDGGSDDRHMELELRHMMLEAEDRAKHEDVEEGNLRGAKAAMDQALDKQEAGGKGKGGYSSPEGDDD